MVTVAPAAPTATSTAAPAMVGNLVHIIMQSDWLIGGLMTIFAALLATMGLVYMKKAQYGFMKTRSVDVSGKEVLDDAKWDKLLSSKTFWYGFVMYVAHAPIMQLALNFAPTTTVKPLGAFEVIFNFFFCYGFLNEISKKVDIWASVVCILAVIIMNMAQPRMMPGYLIDFPLEKMVKFEDSLDWNVGFVAYSFTWILLLLFSGIVITNKILQSHLKIFAWPLFIGLLSSQTGFASKIASTLIWEVYVGRTQVWTQWHTYMVFFFTAVLWVLHLLAVCEGLRQLACRFFVPAVWVVSEVLSMIEFNLFFKEWHHMSRSNLVQFTCAALVCFMAAHNISPLHKVIKPVQRDEIDSPLLEKEKVGWLKWHERVLAIMEEYKIKKPDAKVTAPLEIIEMKEQYESFNRFFPLIYILLVVVLPGAMYYFGQPFGAFVFLTIITCYQAWKMGAHVSLFAYVGIQKMKHYKNADWWELYKAERRSAEKKNKEDGVTNIKWDDVKHFVIIPNYKEEIEHLEETLRHIAASGVAKTNICVVLGMEEREKGSDTKAKTLLDKERRDQKFWQMRATYHPPDLEGEVAGKSSNTRWAAKKVLEEFVLELNLSLDNCILTVADADSEFQKEYFAALSYHFIHQGGDEGKTPDRYLTIWQPPILHYKNYIQQPAIVRAASIIATQHELANLADPNAVKVPYSTYSISALLASKIDGWDPDWISEDWHMCIKCFMATGGRLKVVPIFLGVMNYAPEGDTYFATLKARWDQAKRHALGFSEIVYFQDHFPRIYRSLQTKAERSLFLWRSFFLWVKLLMIHVILGDLMFFGPFNGYLIAYFAKHSIANNLDVNSWTFLVNCFVQVAALTAFLAAFVVGVVIYEEVQDRCQGADDPNLSIFWRSRPLHIASVIPQCLLMFPIVFCLATVTEYLAAIKSTSGHRFKYVVALKAPVPKGAAVAPISDA